MIHECRQYDGEGKLMGVYDVQKIGKMFWASFYTENDMVEMIPVEDRPHLMKRVAKVVKVVCSAPKALGSKRKCGKVFDAKRKHSKYCSPVCKGRAYQTTIKPNKIPVDVSCRECGEIFKSALSSAAYCGIECRKSGNVTMRRAKSEANKISLAKRKLEIGWSKKKVFRQKHTPSHQIS